MRTPVIFLQELIGLAPRAIPPETNVTFNAFIDSLANALSAERLTIVAGAGLSYASGFPTWPKLLEHLSDALIDPTQRAAFDQLAAFDNPLIVARYLKSRLNVGAVFPSAVRTALYQSTVDDRRPNDTLRFLLAIIDLATRRGVRLDIITYNFDDLIEAVLPRELPGIEVASISTEEEFHAPTMPVRILHVHGYLARDPNAQPVLPPPELVLSEEDFHQLMSNPGAWQNQVQAAAFAHRDCLFLGMSMTDPNLRRILDFAKLARGKTGQQRWILNRRYSAGDTLAPGATPMTTDVAVNINAIKADLFRSLAAEPIYLNNFADFVTLTSLVKALS